MKFRVGEICIVDNVFTFDVAIGKIIEIDKWNTLIVKITRPNTKNVRYSKGAELACNNRWNYHAFSNSRERIGNEQDRLNYLYGGINEKAD